MVQNPCWTFENLREPLGHKTTAPSWTWVGGSKEGAPSLIAGAESLSGFLTQPRQQMRTAKAKTGWGLWFGLIYFPRAMTDSFQDRHSGESGVRKARWVTDYISSFKKCLVLIWMGRCLHIGAKRRVEPYFEIFLSSRWKKEPSDLVTKSENGKASARMTCGTKLKKMKYTLIREQWCTGLLLVLTASASGNEQVGNFLLFYILFLRSGEKLFLWKLLFISVLIVLM